MKFKGKLKSFDKFIQESDDDLRFSIKFLKFFKLNEGKEIEVEKFEHEKMVLFNTEEFIFDKNCFERSDER
jgi:hypothetical protein